MVAAQGLSVKDEKGVREIKLSLSVGCINARRSRQDSPRAFDLTAF